MDFDKRPAPDSWLRRPINRRGFLQRSAVGALTLTSIPALIAACSTGQGTSTTGPKRGGTMIIGLEDSPASLNYYVEGDIPTEYLAGNLFSTLVGTDLHNNLIPDLASSWTVSADKTVFTFHLNPNAKWHDGQPVTADDVAYSFTNLWQNDIYSTVLNDNLVSASATDPHTFILTLKKSYAPLLYELQSEWVLPKHIYAGSDLKTNPASNAPIGSGPFKFQQFNKGTSIVLVRNPDYYKPGRPYLDRLIFQTVTDPASRVLAFEKGDIDFLDSYDVPYDRLARYRKDSRFQVIDAGLGVGTQLMLIFNLDNKYLSHPQVRQGIAFALDRDQINQLGVFGQGKVSTSIMASNEPYYTSQNIPVYSHDVAKANQLLDQAGFPKQSDGTRFNLRHNLQTGHDYEDRAAQAIKSQLSQVGIGLTITPLDLNAHQDQVFKKRDFDLDQQLFGTGPEPTDWVSFRYQKATIGHAFSNAAGYINPELEQIFATEMTEPDDAKRRQMWNRVQQVIMTDLPLLPLYEVPNIQIASAKFKNVVTSSLSGYLWQPRDEAYIG